MLVSAECNRMKIVFEFILFFRWSMLVMRISWKKNTETLIDASKEYGVDVNTKN
jgi:hypothetical protein